MPSIALLIWQSERATRLNDWFGFHTETLAADGKSSVTTRLEQGGAQGNGKFAGCRVIVISSRRLGVGSLCPERVRRDPGQVWVLSGY
ncbi:MAG: hypothetical protein ACT4NY_22510, partial [Pseudonocardiales bacterium]